jgi:hypothetical protein
LPINAARAQIGQETPGPDKVAPPVPRRRQKVQGRGWLWLHESWTYVKFTPAGADLFA